MQHAVIFLPGIIAPAALRYGALVEQLPGVRPVLHDLAIYAGDKPPADYAIPIELDALDRAADAAGLDRFHAFGHSAGGAVLMAYAAARGDRLLSLAVDEPASDFTTEGDAVYGWPEFDDALALSPAQSIPAFLRLQVAADVVLPSAPDGPTPDWMAKRPFGMVALVAALRSYRVEADVYARFTAPVYFSRGSRTHPRWAAMQERLATTFPDFIAEVSEGRHHLDPPHQTEPARVAASLIEFWERAESRS